MDYQGLPGDILDEIALEGLDGITISGTTFTSSLFWLKTVKYSNACLSICI